MKYAKLITIGVLLGFLGAGVTYLLVGRHHNEDTFTTMGVPMVEKSRQAMEDTATPWPAIAGAGLPTTQTPQPTSAPAVATIDAGFVFVDGKYVDAPYAVRSEGGTVYINNIIIQRVMAMTYADPTSSDTDPEIPASIRKETSIYDQVVSEYCRRNANTYKRIILPMKSEK